MTSPLPYLIRMLLFLAFVAGLSVYLGDDLLRVFNNTPGLDAVILGVLLIGIFFIFRQVILLWPEVTWLRSFQHREENTTVPPSDRVNLLAPMAAMLGERQDQFRLSPTATRAVLDGIATRLDERRELARYLIGLLIFLGLLGTFWGLLQTIGAVADAINGLQATAGDAVTMFAKLKGSIEGPLKGMSTAFGASLFGLSGSLVLGFLELQASQAQGRFHVELEEWLAGATSIGSGSASLEQPQGAPAYIEALLERNDESVDGLVRALQRVETGRQATVASYGTLLERLAALSETVRTQQTLLARFTELAIELRGSVNRMTDRAAASDEQIPRAIETLQTKIDQLAEDTTRSRKELADEVRTALTKLAERLPEGDRETIAIHQRSIETHLGRLVEESGRDRTALADELRGEIRLLARTLSISRPSAPPAVAEPPAET